MRRCAALLVAVVVLASSCSGERPVLEESAAREVAPSGGATTTTLIEGEVLPLRLAVGSGWSGDPADASPASVTARVLADLLFEGLTRIDDAGEPAPALASEWFVSDDRLTWTFVLDEMVVDGAGLPIEARDIKRSLERAVSRGLDDQAALALDPVAGWDDFVAGRAGGLAGVSVPNVTTVVVQISRPYEQLAHVLAAPAFGITGEIDGVLRTTGAYRYGDTPDVIEAVDADANVQQIELVGESGADAVSSGAADWAVLDADDRSDEIAGDVVRQPLELQVAIVARHPNVDTRHGALGALSPLLLAGAVDSLTARAVTTNTAASEVPDALVVDYPTGALRGLGEAIVDQLEAAGIAVLPIVSDPADFAARVASGEATLFPVVLASGAGAEAGLLRLATPGAVDDAIGVQSISRTELATAIAAESDDEQRAVLLAALEQELVDEGLLLPIGSFEVRVALSRRADGIRHRLDGTLDLSGVNVSQ